MSDMAENAKERSQREFDERSEEIQEEVDKISERVNKALDDESADDETETSAAADVDGP
ncbi:hypothetical protein BH18ACT4_BH18ACT4_12820 [soil metagenome]